MKPSPSTTSAVRIPIGKRIAEGGQKPEIEIVGVVRNARTAGLREAPSPYWWVPYQQLTRNRFGALTLYARTKGDPEQIISSVREAVASVDRRVAMFSVQTLETQLDNNLRVQRALATLTVFFAGLAALLAAVGLFGVLAYSVARREREIGIRIALGAAPYQASWTVLREVTIYVALGLAGRPRDRLGGREFGRDLPLRRQSKGRAVAGICLRSYAADRASRCVPSCPPGGHSASRRGIPGGVNQRPTRCPSLRLFSWQMNSISSLSGIRT